jgi:SAM-dependent methyltransferase
VRPHLARTEGRRLFGLDAETYDRTRPGHADAVYEILRDRCELCPGTKVLEIGPGTGQASRRLLELGADPLVGVEPDPRLADFLRASLGSRIELRVTALEDAQLESDFDMTSAASSFHWVDEAVGLEKICDALQPGGWVALWWTVFTYNGPPDPFQEALDPLFADVPRGPSASRDGRPPFALDAERRRDALATAGFADVGHERIAWARSWDTDGIRGLYASFSPVRALEPERRAKLLDSIAEIAESRFGGTVELSLVSALYTARKPL